MEFFDGAVEISEAEVTEQVIDDGLDLVAKLWHVGIAHRDIKPANLMVRDGHLKVIDAFFAQVRPSPWRQAVDLANMMLVLALGSDAGDRLRTRAPPLHARRDRGGVRRHPRRREPVPAASAAEGGRARPGRRVPPARPRAPAGAGTAVEPAAGDAHGHGRPRRSAHGVPDRGELGGVRMRATPRRPSRRDRGRAPGRAAPSRIEPRPVTAPTRRRRARPPRAGGPDRRRCSVRGHGAGRLVATPAGRRATERARLRLLSSQGGAGIIDLVLTEACDPGDAPASATPGRGGSAARVYDAPTSLDPLPGRALRGLRGGVRSVPTTRSRRGSGRPGAGGRPTRSRTCRAPTSWRPWQRTRTATSSAAPTHPPARADEPLRRRAAASPPSCAASGRAPLRWVRSPRRWWAVTPTELAPVTTVPAIGGSTQRSSGRSPVPRRPVHLARAALERPRRRAGHDPAPDRRDRSCSPFAGAGSGSRVRAHLDCRRGPLTWMKTLLPPWPAAGPARRHGRLLVPVGPRARCGRDDRSPSFLAFLPAGPRRRRWEWLAVAYSFTMAFSASTWAPTGSPTSSSGPCSAPASRSTVSAIAVEVRDLIFQAEHRPIRPTTRRPRAR